MHQLKKTERREGRARLEGGERLKEWKKRRGQREKKSEDKSK